MYTFIHVSHKHCKFIKVDAHTLTLLWYLKSWLEGRNKEEERRNTSVSQKHAWTSGSKLKYSLYIIQHSYTTESVLDDETTQTVCPFCLQTTKRLRGQKRASVSERLRHFSPLSWVRWPAPAPGTTLHRWRPASTCASTLNNCYHFMTRKADFPWLDSSHILLRVENDRTKCVFIGIVLMVKVQPSNFAFPL